MKKLALAALAFVVGWVWGFLSLRALLQKAKRSVSPSAVLKRAADEYDSVAGRLSFALEEGRSRARTREAELRRRFGLEW